MPEAFLNFIDDKIGEFFTFEQNRSEHGVDV
jgi:hypothetical protein